MSGTSRLSYHAVPKVFPDPSLDTTYWQYSSGPTSDAFKETKFYVDDGEWASFNEYIKCNRINMNIRQVY